MNTLSLTLVIMGLILIGILDIGIILLLIFKCISYINSDESDDDLLEIEDADMNDSEKLIQEGELVDSIKTDSTPRSLETAKIGDKILKRKTGEIGVVDDIGRAPELTIIYIRFNTDAKSRRVIIPTDSEEAKQVYCLVD